MSNLLAEYQTYVLHLLFSFRDAESSVGPRIKYEPVNYISNHIQNVIYDYNRRRKMMFLVNTSIN